MQFDEDIGRGVLGWLVGLGLVDTIPYHELMIIIHFMYPISRQMSVLI